MPRFRPSQAVSSSPRAQNDQLLAAAFDHAPQAMAVMSVDGSIVQANKRLCRLLGFSHAELCTLRSGDVVHPDDAETEREQRRRLAAADIGRFDLVQRYVRKDLRTIWARVAVSAVRNGSPESTYLVAELECVPPYGCSEEVVGHEVWFARLGDATLAAIHEIGNTLTPLMLNTEMLVEQTTEDVGQSAQAIFKAARRIAFALRRLRRVHDPQSVAYIGQNRMNDLRLIQPPALRTSTGSGEAGAA